MRWIVIKSRPSGWKALRSITGPLLLKGLLKRGMTHSQDEHTPDIWLVLCSYTVEENNSNPCSKFAVAWWFIDILEYGEFTDTVLV